MKYILSKAVTIWIYNKWNEPVSLLSNYVLKYVFYTESNLNSQVWTAKKMDGGRVDDSFPLVIGREETPQVAYTVFDDSEFSLTERLKESQKVYMIFRWGVRGGEAQITQSLTM